MHERVKLSIVCDGERAKAAVVRTKVRILVVAEETTRRWGLGLRRNALRTREERSIMQLKEGVGCSAPLERWR